MTEPSLHVHIWSKDADKIVHETEVPSTDLYVTGAYESDEEGHVQFAGMIRDEHFEIRLSVKDLRALLTEVEQLRKE